MTTVCSTSCTQDVCISKPVWNKLWMVTYFTETVMAKQRMGYWQKTVISDKRIIARLAHADERQSMVEHREAIVNCKLLLCVAIVTLIKYFIFLLSLG